MNCIIEKGIKDRQHPYVMISRSLIDDQEASIGLRMLIITCLSKPDNWKHNVTNMAKCLGVGRDTVYKYLNEGIELGYIERHQEKIKGKFSSGSYKIYEEKQEIQKILPFRENPDAVKPDMENHDHSNKEILEKNSFKQATRMREEIPEKTEDVPKSPIAAASQTEKKETISYVGPQRKFMSITRSDVHRAFIGKGIDASIIEQALDRFSQRKTVSSNPIGVIECIIGDLISPRNTFQNSAEKMDAKKLREQERIRKLEEHRQKPKGKVRC